MAQIRIALLSDGGATIAEDTRPISAANVAVLTEYLAFNYNMAGATNVELFNAWAVDMFDQLRGAVKRHAGYKARNAAEPII